MFENTICPFVRDEGRAEVAAGAAVDVGDGAAAATVVLYVISAIALLATECVLSALSQRAAREIKQARQYRYSKQQCGVM